ncbi:hypothetical protein [Ensifer sp. MJa1]|uniref:hypothetical protein n=1 Tax=Ensifer sp. MJa1 TaxID=2919888 RepID=UPI00300B07DA
MEKTHVTHVSVGFVFLGHRIIRKRGAHGRMSVITTIPKEKAKGFVRRLTETLFGNHSVSTVDMIASLYLQFVGCAAFCKLTDFTAYVFQRIDHVVFWKMAHWRGSAAPSPCRSQAMAPISWKCWRSHLPSCRSMPFSGFKLIVAALAWHFSWLKSDFESVWTEKRRDGQVLNKLVQQQVLVADI